MNILYIGDIMGEPGISVVEEILPGFISEKDIDCVIAQAENVTDGKGMSRHDMKRLQSAGIDFFTGGNHTPSRKELWPFLKDDTEPVIGPANMPDCPGTGWGYAETKSGKVLIISLLGGIVGKDADKPIDNPLTTIDAILSQEKSTEKSAIVVNLHGDYSSEKIVIGHYLDGLASLVVGDHWHVPTADARILPGRTAHITDVGMCGVLNSSLGVKYTSIIPRWRDGNITKNELEVAKPYQFNAVLAEIDSNGLAVSINHIHKILT